MIARDNVTNLQDFGSASSGSFSHTCNGSNRMLLVGVLINDLSDTITGVTYNGVAMTKVPSGTATQPGGGGRTERLDLFYLINPASGSNTVAYTGTGGFSNGVTLCAISYTGVHQTSGLNISKKANATGSTGLSLSETTTVDDCWAVSMVRNDSGSITNGTNYFAQTSDNSIEMGDSNGSLGSAGSKTVSMGGPSGGKMCVTAFIAPAVTAQATNAGLLLALV